MSYYSPARASMAGTLGCIVKPGKELEGRDASLVLTLGMDPLVSVKRGPAQVCGAFALIRCDGSARLVRDDSPSRSSRGCSSAGRALQSHCRGQGFDPPQLHCFFEFLKID